MSAPEPGLPKVCVHRVDPSGANETVVMSVLGEAPDVPVM
jgi:hypothetical protein